MPKLGYSQLMSEEPAHIILKLDTHSPIEIEDFVASFTSVAGQYDKFIRQRFPELAPDAKVYVREIRVGCIEADLIPWAVAGASAMINRMDQILIIEEFVKTYAGRISAYFRPGGKDPTAGKSDLKDFTGAVAAIANDPNGSATLSAAYFEDGKKKIKAAFQFDTAEARRASDQIEAHKKELEHKSSADHPRKLMRFGQSNINFSKPGKRSGELVTIESISPKSYPLIYASDLAEQRIKHEIIEEPDNIYKKGFIVDVNEERSGGKIIAYRVTHVHQVIDIIDQGDED